MHIDQYPDLEGLREWAENLWYITLRDFMEDQGIQDGPPFDLSEVLVVGQWGSGGATIGQNPLQLAFVFEGPIDRETQDQIERILTSADQHIRGDVVLIEDLPTVPPGPQNEWFEDIEIVLPIATEDGLESFVDLRIRRQPGRPAVYSLSTGDELVIESAEEVEIERTWPQRDIPVEALLELNERVKESDDVDNVDLDISSPQSIAELLKVPEELIPEELDPNLPASSINVTSDEEVGLKRVEREVEEEPEEPEDVYEDEEEEKQLIGGQFTVEDKINEDAGEVEVPTGKKQTTNVEYRPLYDFEIELLTPGDGGTDLDIDMEGIGYHLASGSFGFTAPPVTFPRTGVYIKHRLDKEGEAYVRQLHKDVCRYSWGIIEEHGILVRPGLYENFRGTVHRLREAGLIRKLSVEEALARGLEVRPKTPDGREAPFLEPRSWHELDAGLDDPAWKDVSDYLYGED